MHRFFIFRKYLYIALCAALFLTGTTTGNLQAKRKKPVIKDYRKKLNPKYKKEARKSTRFIIVHTSEAGLVSTLRTLSQGKKVRGNYRTYGGHSHYAVARNGVVYRIMHHRYRADHAGLSMWNGIDDVSSHSVGIELVGYHYDKITPQQYRSLTWLVKTLRKTYKIPGKNVLTHCQISYGKGNQWVKRPHRGRKRCALNFDRDKIGLANQAWTYDPDVKAGRLVPDRQIYTMFYKPSRFKKVTTITAQAQVKEKPVPASTELSNVIGKENTAWNIAGEDYDSPETLYVLPDKREIRGDKIKKAVGWGSLPAGTRVLLNHPLNAENTKGPILEITREFTAWSYAGKAYKERSTYYFFADGKIVPGTHVEDWDNLPAGTRMIVGYDLPVTIKPQKGRTPWGIAGKKHNQKDTVYYIPGKQLVTGDRMEDFNHLPRGSRVFLKLADGSTGFNN